MLRSAASSVSLFALWCGLLVGKYATLALFGQVYYHFFDHEWFFQLICVFIGVIATTSIYGGIASSFGISVYDAWMSGASREKVTTVSYKGRIREGFLSDHVEITPVVKSESEHDRLNKLFGWIMIMDMILIFTGALDGFFPFMLLW